MTKNKDQKRVIRARMNKTGESYTAARAVIRAKQDKRVYAAPRSQWPALAGMADDKLKEKTGRTWAEWVAVLDAAGAHRSSHRDIARHISASHPEIGGWWTQTVTVGYERIRGLRDVGQSRDGDYQANKSRTFAVDVSTLYRMFKDSRRRKKWLPEGFTKVRTAIEDKSMRVDWHDDTQVNFFFTSKGPGKSTVSVQHTKLESQADVARAKALWSEHLDALGDALA